MARSSLEAEAASIFDAVGFASSLEEPKQPRSRSSLDLRRIFDAVGFVLMRSIWKSIKPSEKREG